MPVTNHCFVEEAEEVRSSQAAQQWESKEPEPGVKMRQQPSVDGGPNVSHVKLQTTLAKHGERKPPKPPKRVHHKSLRQDRTLSLILADVDTLAGRLTLLLSYIEMRRLLILSRWIKTGLQLITRTNLK